MSSMCFVYPLEFSQTRLAADVGKSIEKREFKGLRDVISKVHKTDGLGGLYRGFPFAAIGIFFFRGLYFGLFDTGKTYLFGNGKTENFFLMWAFAQAVTFTSELGTYPLDTVKRRMMMQSGRPENERQYKNSLDCVSKVFKNEGMKAFYHGALSNVL